MTHTTLRRLPPIAAIAFATLTLAYIAGAESVDSPQSTFSVGVGARGVFDPSVSEDPSNGRLWMSYSSFDASTHSRWGVSLRLAYSDDGATWHEAGSVQQFKEVAVGPLAESEAGEVAVEAESRGTWQNETSTLVYDEHAPREQRWKLFWHQALWVGDVPRYAGYSWIALKMADAPENLERATPIKLFTGYMSRSAGESDAAPAFSPIAQAAAIQLDKKDPQLGACVFGQPAALSAPDGLYLALDCEWLGTRPTLHTTLLRCAYPGCDVTNAASWTVVGRLTEPRDAQRIDESYKGLGGTALAMKDGQYYLIATPVTAQGNRYDGCVVLKFADLAHGALERGRRGKLVVAQTVRGIADTHHGACAAHARLTGGILLSQIISTAAPRIMQIRSSGVRLP